MTKLTSLAAVAFTMLAATCTNLHAGAVTYVFSQTGFVDGGGDAGTLTTTVTGTPEAGGVLQLGDLTSFSSIFQETVNGVPENFDFYSANDFYYDPNSAGSLEFSTGSGQFGIEACSGGDDVNFVCEGLSPSSGERLDAYGFFEDLPDFGVSLTQQDAVVKLSKDPPSAVPEPGTTVLFVTGLALLFVTAGRAKLR
jgi:hypothetical protein